MPDHPQRKEQTSIGPWPDVATARSFLGRLAGLPDKAATTLPPLNWSVVADWLVAQGVGPLAYDGYRELYPALAERLQADHFTAVAQNSLYDESLVQIEAAFQEAGIPFVLLKGAALAQTVYSRSTARTMSDIDIWVAAEAMPQAAAAMQGLGFRAYTGREDRPLALQILSRGEIQFYGRQWGMIELHWSPFPGWWLARTAAVDETAVWQRTIPIQPGKSARQLAAEDMVIQVAVHLAVNHQFGVTPVRGLIDLALVAQAQPIDWAVVIERAKAWRVATAVWQALSLLEGIIGTPGLEPVLARLCPSRRRQRLLRRLVAPEGVLAGGDLRDGRSRYLLLLLLVDRPQDMVRLVWRTLWPEPEWLAARYQETVSRRHHLWQVVRYGRV